MNFLQRMCKRMFDVICSFLSLIVFSPLFLICYLRIKGDDRGPAIYSQERIGKGGRPFRIYKFRTMHTGSEPDDPVLAESDNDPRLTNSGKFLRQHHLDELPQIWNVLKGDMSFVGPRPERQYFIDQIMLQDKRYTLLYKLRPGVTSEATLYNGYTDTMDKMIRRLEMDIEYLQKRSLSKDLCILGKTFFSIISGKKF